MYRAIVPLLLALVLVACDAGSAARPAAPPAPPAGQPAGGDYPPLPAGLPRATVLRVVDGDTIAVDLDGREERVRLIGINTPETVDPRRPVECFGKEASDAAKALLNGQAVLLEDDRTQDSRDANGRLLRYVWLEDGRMANLEQVARGFAAEYTYEAPYKYRDLFRAAQAAARDARLGLWAPETCNGQFIPAGSTPAPEAPLGGSADLPRCPAPPDPAAAPNRPVRIVGLDKAGEQVELEHTGDAPVSLDGWLLCSVRGNEAQGGLGGTMEPGQRRVFANSGQPIWSNSSQDDAALFDSTGQLVSYWADRP